MNLNLNFSADITAVFFLSDRPSGQRCPVCCTESHLFQSLYKYALFMVIILLILSLFGRLKMNKNI